MIGDLLELICIFHIKGEYFSGVGIERNNDPCSKVVIGDLFELAIVFLLVHSLRLLYHGSGLGSNLTHLFVHDVTKYERMQQHLMN